MNKSAWALVLSLIASSANGAPPFHPAPERVEIESGQRGADSIKIVVPKSKWAFWSDSDLRIKAGGPIKVDLSGTKTRIIRIKPLEIEHDVPVRIMDEEKAEVPLPRFGVSVRHRPDFARAGRRKCDPETMRRVIASVREIFAGLAAADGSFEVPDPEADSIALPEPRRVSIAPPPWDLSDWDGHSIPHVRGVRADGPIYFVNTDDGMFFGPSRI